MLSDYLKKDALDKVLVKEWELFPSIAELRKLFEDNNNKAICNGSKLHKIAYVFRELCPNSCQGERILSTEPKRKLWDILAARLSDSKGKTWKKGYLKNLATDVKKQVQICTEVDGLISALRKDMGEL